MHLRSSILCLLDYWQGFLQAVQSRHIAWKQQTPATSPPIIIILTQSNGQFPLKENFPWKFRGFLFLEFEIFVEVYGVTIFKAATLSFITSTIDSSLKY